ncbi:succinylglutamate-semialdehyde dehydrogenase [Parvularcula lutaonensis]|uniref:Succinylglutamate-semialdehyde dehydrogenase n=1 Tax=Parvularcula lutaonensis TaxID=491923 RepID=A0ABV7MFE8_9PROT|nr:succinylglutamate-semialdehyde dehydrogenase [Parvularcula lutaonensis]GGY53313.1 N-succinylglutamate 5-semialdehyde dehydrogenase [Parvularcula lutaonensis]
MIELKNWIGGAWTEGTGPRLESVNPANGEIIAAGSMAGTDQAAEAAEAAAQAFGGWRRKSYDERKAVIERFAEIAAERKDEMARLIAQETGKALWDATTEAGGIAGKAALAVASYEERTPTREKDNGQLKLRIAHKPHGVMVVIGPFNFPGHLPNGQIIPSLLAGNTVVFKPSEQTPAVGQKMCEWWEEAGLPAGCLNLVHGDREVAQALIGHEKTAGVLFTGGLPAGRAIHQQLAGRPDVMLALELGGNNPLIVWDVANADDAAQIIARSAYITSGQRCTCARRLIVKEGEEGDRIIKAVADLIPQLSVGDPLAEDQPFMGPLISKESAENALKAQEALIADGAEPIVKMERSPAGPAYVTPGLIDVTAMGDKDPDEEVFAPLLKVIRVKTFDEALDEANDTRFGLAAALLSDDESLWERFAGEIRAGIVNWNRQTTGASGAMPFGGPGLSGNHRPAGSYAADFAAWPMASMMSEGPLKDDQAVPGRKA